MRWLCVVAVVLSVAACKRVPTPTPFTSSGGQGTVVELGDPASNAHIVEGLYQIEFNAWRWSAQRFVVELVAPPGSDERGARLRLALTVPEPVIAQNHEATLSCSANGTPLPPERWTAVGPQVLERELPPIVGVVVRLECAVGKTLPHGPVDKRDLGIIVRSLRLDPR